MKNKNAVIVFLKNYIKMWDNVETDEQRETLCELYNAFIEVAGLEKLSADELLADIEYMQPNNIPEPGAASILIELEAGKVTIKHGTDDGVLSPAAKVYKGAWEKLLATVKQVISETTIRD